MPAGTATRRVGATVRKVACAPIRGSTPATLAPARRPSATQTRPTRFQFADEVVAGDEAGERLEARSRPGGRARRSRPGRRASPGRRPSLPRGGRSGSSRQHHRRRVAEAGDACDEPRGPSLCETVIARSAGAALQQPGALGVRLEPVGDVPAHRHDLAGRCSPRCRRPRTRPAAPRSPLPAVLRRGVRPRQRDRDRPGCCSRAPRPARRRCASRTGSHPAHC